MCGLCGVLGADSHVLEGTSDGARRERASAPRRRRLERARRVRLVNRVLAPFGCVLRDWNGARYVLRGPSGKTALLDNLPQVWRALERMAARPVDPLDPALIADLRRGPGVTRA